MLKLLGKILFYVILILLAITTIIPFIWMVLSSFKSNAEIVSLAQTFLPSNWNLSNYQKLQSTFNFIRYFRNSLFVAATVTTIAVYTSAITGYVLSKYKFRGKGAMFAYILGTMMVPWAVTIIPKYQIFVKAGLQDTYTSLILPAIFSSFGIFMMRQSMLGIPNEILEAARADGAGEFYIFHRIVLPMSVNAISALAIFQFLGAWEDYLWPYLMINSPEKQLLPVGLTMFSGQYQTDYGGMFAATTISILPVLIVYMIFQKRFIQGVASGSVKG